MHPYWTAFFYIKFGLAIFAGLYFGITESILMGLSVFAGAIIGTTIIANALYQVLRVVAPALVIHWELAEARQILGAGEPENIEKALDEIDFDVDETPKKAE